MAVYSFNRQNAHGRLGEDFLDAFFEQRGNYVQPATRWQQKQGIDRIFARESKLARVEYKTDFIAHRSERVFIETVRLDQDEKSGWAYTSQADLLVYFIPGARVIYVMPLETLREQLPRWSALYPSRPVHNETYTTRGVLVPLAEFERFATQIFRLHTNSS
ncbi:MAG TPA: hypothetical protein PK801_14635 [Aggregatilineales bacterium]|jgi:hypothetical protein|nr:hypothetical protein [Chloroflexota bacterium]HOA25293.1 hypothetical protein [Aggregatilineales bacterium]HPV07465.1 hypothetical protein [Aggregatilineales bacterium]HQA69559.1 hypothetical protein [Aggregatilineales bacterium]HQE17573.1 hypothetical protein [Aggregatilineales bacterium]